MRPWWVARVLFWTLDAVYGKAFTIEKLRVVELVARVPYTTWDDVGFIAVTHTHGNPEFARRIVDQSGTAHDQAENETWHLLILEEMLRLDGHRHTLLRGWVIPQALALVYYWISMALYVVRPRWSHRLNVSFERHAEGAYRQFIDDHAERATAPWNTNFRADYDTRCSTHGELFAPIAEDEREHRERSERLMQEARFS